MVEEEDPVGTSRYVGMVKKYAPNILLREERERRNWTLADVAERIGLPDPHSVSRWERGVNFPGPRYRRELCRIFGKGPAELRLLKPAKGEEMNAKTNVAITAMKPEKTH